MWTVILDIKRNSLLFQKMASFNCVYGPDTITVTHEISGNFDVKEVSFSRRPIVKKVDRIMGIVESERQVVTALVTQDLRLHKNPFKIILMRLDAKRNN